MTRATDWLHRHQFAIAVALGNGIALGFGRFAYNALLPQMREGLSTTSAAMALLATMNVGGYVVGSALSSGVLQRWRADRVVIVSLCAIATGLMALALAPSVMVAGGLMAVVGTSSAFIFIANTGVLSQAVGSSRGIAFGIATAGIGVGNVLASIAAAGVAALGTNGWRLAYGAFALIATTAAFALRRRLRLALRVGDAAPSPSPREQAESKRIAAPGRYWIFPSYMAWGLTMIIYTTFFATFLVDERAVAESTAAAIYSLVGVTTVVGGLVVGPLSDRFGRRRMLLFTFLGVGTSVGVVLWAQHPVAYVVSALLFGIPISGVGALAMSFISDTWPDEEVGPLFGRLTLAFGIVIVAGPSLSAWIVDATGSLQLALILALGSVGVGLLATARLPATTQRHVKTGA